MKLGFGSILTLIFIALKLTHQINWSWWWVLSPIWVSALVVFVVIFLLAALKALSEG